MSFMRILPALACLFAFPAAQAASATPPSKDTAPRKSHCRPPPPGFPDPCTPGGVRYDDPAAALFSIAFDALAEVDPGSLGLHSTKSSGVATTYVTGAYSKDSSTEIAVTAEWVDGTDSSANTRPPASASTGAPSGNTNIEPSPTSPSSGGTSSSLRDDCVVFGTVLSNTSEFIRVQSIAGISFRFKRSPLTTLKQDGKRKDWNQLSSGTKVTLLCNGATLLKSEGEFTADATYVLMR